jgi:hypothetical protein
MNYFGNQAREKQSMMTKIKKPQQAPSETRPTEPVAPKSSGRLDDLLNSLKSGSFKIEESVPTTGSKELPSRKTSNPSKGSSALGSSKALDFFESFAFSSSFDSTLSADLKDFCL